jgi:hypothetical protein
MKNCVLAANVRDGAAESAATVLVTGSSSCAATDGDSGGPQPAANPASDPRTIEPMNQCLPPNEHSDTLRLFVVIISPSR